MKKLLIIALTMLSFNSIGSSYCYDSAVFAVSDAREAVGKCGTTLPLDKFSNVINKLQSRNPIGYSKRILKAMKKLKILVNSEVYEYGLSKSDRKCVERAAYKTNQKMNSEVLEAIIFCM